MIAQSHAIARFAGNRAGLYPKDDFEAALVDEVIEAMEHFVNLVLPSAISEKGAGKRYRVVHDFVNHTGKVHLNRLAKRISSIQREGPFLLGRRLTVADLWVASLGRFLTSGYVSGVPKDLYEPYPVLSRLMKAVFDHPSVKAYYASI